MAEVSHTSPTTGESFGDSQVFARGKIAVVDGGESNCRSAADGDDATRRPADDADRGSDDHEDEPMGEIDHTPREDAPDTTEVYARGGKSEEDTEENPDVEADV